MTDPRNLRIEDFTYPLPEQRIARYPLERRDDSKLLVYRAGQINDSVYRALPDHLPDGTLLVFNNTRVLEARLLFQKPTGGTIELFCLEPHERYADITQGMAQQAAVMWCCLVGGASKWKPGQVLEKKFTTTAGECRLEARFVEKRPDCFIIEFSWTPQAWSFAELLHEAGVIPLPPYLKRAAEKADTERYQTVYASREGSVAAPTAGLHFTGDLLETLAARGIDCGYVTLHVGAGTFQPVKVTQVGDHPMHAEWIDVSRASIAGLLAAQGRPVVAVGTTSLRTLESLYWIGCKLLKDPDSPEIEVGQWEPYGAAETDITPGQSMQALLDWLDRTGRDRLITLTRILIAPEYRCRMVQGLITNFHQPQSTLLLLIAALVGEDWRLIYHHALDNEYRFLSYGDGSLLWVREWI